MPSILAIVPARSGSKGIPGKNIKNLAGKPMIAWTIAAALSIPDLRLIVSTDSEEIAQLAQTLGAETPFLRPDRWSTDQASSVDVVDHALGWATTHGCFSPEFIMLLQPTSPLRSSDDIYTAIRLQQEFGADAVVSVTPVEHSTSWLVNVGADGRLIPAQGFNQTKRRQDVAPLFTLNGAIYFIRTSVFVTERKFIPERTFAYVMPAERSIDIDTPWDFYLADLVLKDKYGMRSDS